MSALTHPATLPGKRLYTFVMSDDRKYTVVVDDRVTLSHLRRTLDESVKCDRPFLDWAVDGTGGHPRMMLLNSRHVVSVREVTDSVGGRPV